MSDECQPASHGSIDWSELITNDRDKAKKFYGDLVGWKMTDMDLGEPVGTYTVVKTESGAQSFGGIMQMFGEAWKGRPSHWIPYITVDDVDASLKKAVELGATLCAPCMDIPGVGRFCAIQDPTGAEVYLITYAQPDDS